MCQGRDDGSIRSSSRIAARKRAAWALALLSGSLLAGAVACGGDTSSTADQQREDLSTNIAPCWTSTSGITCVDAGPSAEDGGQAEPDDGGAWTIVITDGGVSSTASDGGLRSEGEEDAGRSSHPMDGGCSGGRH